MFKTLRANARKRKIKQAIKRHGVEFISGLVLGLLADAVTELAQAHMRKRILKRFS